MKIRKIFLLFLTIFLFFFSSCTQTGSDKTPKEVDAPSMVEVMDLLTSQFDSSGNLRQDENPVGNIVFDFCFNFVYPLELSYSNGNTKEVQSLENLVFVLILDFLQFVQFLLNWLHRRIFHYRLCHPILLMAFIGYQSTFNWLV